MSKPRLSYRYRMRPITVFINREDRDAMRRISLMHGIPQSLIVRTLLADAFRLMRQDKLPEILKKLKQEIAERN